MSAFGWATGVESVPSDGAALLDDVHRAYTKYVIFPTPEAADAATLYTAATHGQPAWEHATRLVVKSPIRRCGKTRLQEVARELTHNALPATNISSAALARSIIEADPPTLILDEADAVWGKKDQRSESAEDLRGILNSGHSRGWPYVRWDPKSRQREDCPTFAMAIIGGIGDMPDTIEDRAVVIGLRRRAPGEQVSQWRTRRAVPQLRELRDRLHEWVRGCLEKLADADPDLPAEDRAADCWAPLVAIADAAGGDWPERARTACKALTAGLDDPDDGTAGERLLADLYTVWGDASHAPTATLLERLHALDESPWGDWDGKPLTARALAKLLRPYGIKSKVIRVGSDTPRGYIRTDLADAWRRYATSATTQHDDGNPPIDGPNGRCTTVADADFVAATPSGPPNPWPPGPSVADVADVADERLERATDQDDDYCPTCGRDYQPDGTCPHCDRAAS